MMRTKKRKQKTNEWTGKLRRFPGPSCNASYPETEQKPYRLQTFPNLYWQRRLRRISAETGEPCVYATTKNSYWVFIEILNLSRFCVLCDYNLRELFVFSKVVWFGRNSAVNATLELFFSLLKERNTVEQSSKLETGEKREWKCTYY